MRSLWALLAGGAALGIVALLRGRTRRRQPSPDDLGTISDQWRADASRIASDY